RELPLKLIAPTSVGAFELFKPTENNDDDRVHQEVHQVRIGRRSVLLQNGRVQGRRRRMLQVRLRAMRPDREDHAPQELLRRPVLLRADGWSTRTDSAATISALRDLDRRLRRRL